MIIVKVEKKPFYEDVVMAGFGGQGLMFIGKLLAYSAMKEDQHVTWIPSYGPEMRGGTANCTVVISNEEIGPPVVSHPRSVVVMNNPSMEAFEPKIQKDGLLLLSSSMVNSPVTRSDIKTLAVPASELAALAGNEKAANMVMLGAYVAVSKVVSEKSISEGLKEMFSKKMDLFEINIRAFEAGMKFAVQQTEK